MFTHKKSQDLKFHSRKISKINVADMESLKNRICPLWTSQKSNLRTWRFVKFNLMGLFRPTRVSWPWVTCICSFFSRANCSSLFFQSAERWKEFFSRQHFPSVIGYCCPFRQGLSLVYTQLQMSKALSKVTLRCLLWSNIKGNMNSNQAMATEYYS